MAIFTIKGRYRDLRRCLKSIGSFTDGQARILDWDAEKLDFVRLEITPNDGAYKDGTFIFELRFPETYPEEPPTVNCVTNVYHPNIDPTADQENVCLNLFSEWQSTFGLDDVVQGLLFLFYNPNLEDPLAPYFSGIEDDEFEEKVQQTLKGEKIEGFDPGDECEIELGPPLPTEVQAADEMVIELDKRVCELELNGEMEDFAPRENEDEVEDGTVQENDDEEDEDEEIENENTNQTASTTAQLVDDEVPVSRVSEMPAISVTDSGEPATVTADSAGAETVTDTPVPNAEAATSDTNLERPCISRQTSKTGYMITNDAELIEASSDNNNNANNEEYHKPYVELNRGVLDLPEFDYMLMSLGATCWNMCTSVR